MDPKAVYQGLKKAIERMLHWLEFIVNSEESRTAGEIGHWVCLWKIIFIALIKLGGPVPSGWDDYLGGVLDCVR